MRCRMSSTVDNFVSLFSFSYFFFFTINLRFSLPKSFYSIFAIVIDNVSKTALNLATESSSKTVFSFHFSFPKYTVKYRVHKSIKCQAHRLVNGMRNSLKMTSNCAESFESMQFSSVQQCVHYSSAELFQGTTLIINIVIMIIIIIDVSRRHGWLNILYLCHFTVAPLSSHAPILNR